MLVLAPTSPPGGDEHTPVQLPHPPLHKGWDALGLVPPYQEGRDGVSKVPISLSSMQLHYFNT